MCMSCGCHMYDDDMGDPRTIIVKTFEEAAAKAGITKEQLMQTTHEHLVKGEAGPEIPDSRYQAAAEAMGQTKKEAMDETRQSIEALTK